MEEKRYGLLSGKYDSTKQRAVLLAGSRKRNYKSYTLTMRMELLLTGQLVFTDAQFFDGLYFHWLAKEEEEWTAFKQLFVPFADSFAGEHPAFSIAVKCRPQADDQGGVLRPDMNQVVNQMYCKPFLFSSIEEETLSQAVLHIGAGCTEDQINEFKEKEEDPASQTVAALEAYIKYIENGLMDGEAVDATGERNSLAKEWASYGETLRKLFQIQPNKWGYLESQNHWLSNFKLKDCFDQAFSSDAGCSYRQKMNKLLSETEHILKKPKLAEYFATIRSELAKDYMNRSVVVAALDDLEQRMHQDEPVFQAQEDEEQKKNGQAKKTFVAFRQLMNDRYNKALAYQHGCRFVDLCDYPQTIQNNHMEYDRLLMSTPENAILLPKKLTDFLATISWKEFVTWLKDHKALLEAPLQKWLRTYDDFREGKAAITAIQATLGQYIADLETAARTVRLSTENTLDQFSLWDQQGMCSPEVRRILEDGSMWPYYFVGGGSFEASPEGDELCILCVDESGPKQPMEVVRLRLDNGRGSNDIAADQELDTLLAPVCNPLNGGEALLD